MSAMSIEQAIDELRDLVRCRCHPGFKDRGLRDPACNCDSAEAVEVLANALPAVQPDARETALREALAAVNAKWRSGADTPGEMRGLALAEAAIFDLIESGTHD